MEKMISIPATKMAADDATLKAKREELKKRLLENKKVYVGGGGNVMRQDKDAVLATPEKTKLASNDDILKKKREELKKRLLANKPVYVGGGGNVMGQEKDAVLITPEKTKLAALKQWYEKDPVLLEAEKAAMGQAFPNFVLGKLPDGRLYWQGALNIGVMGDNVWNVLAVYDNDHPRQIMGSSVKVYLVEPDIDELIDGLGWRPHHLLRDSAGQTYLCTTEAQSVKATKKESTSALTVLGWAVKWLMAFELVLTGDLSMEDFNAPGKI